MTVPPPQQPGYWTPTRAPRLGTAPGRTPTNVWAWTGLIVSVSGFLFNLGVNGMLGIAFSVIGLREARRLQAAGYPDTSRSIALAGLVTGIVHVIVTIGLIVLAVFAWTWFAEWIATVTTQLQSSNLS